MSEPDRPDPAYVVTLSPRTQTWIAWAAEEIERLRAALAVYADHGRWHSGGLPSHHVIFLAPGGKSHGWTVAEEALK